MKKVIITLSAILFALILFGLKINENDSNSGTAAHTASTSTTTESITVTTATTTEIITLATATSAIDTPPAEVGENPIVKTAEALLGIDFAIDGASPSEGFDNSGFIYYVLRENGYISCPRQISGQLEWGENTDYSNMKAGDVAYFSEEPGGEASFGGIYTGGGTLIYAPYPGEKVKSVDITTTYWQERFAAALSL